MNPEQEQDQCESDIDGVPVGSPHSPILEDPDCDGCREEFGHPKNCLECPYRNHPKAKPTPDPTKLDFSKLSETKIFVMGDLEELKWLLGEAVEELTEWRKIWELDKTHIDASEKYILDAVSVLEKMEEGDVQKCHLCGEPIFCYYCTPPPEETEGTNRIANEILDEIFERQRNKTIRCETCHGVFPCPTCSEPPTEEPNQAPSDSAARAKWILDHAGEPLPTELSYLKDAHPRVKEYANRTLKEQPKEPVETRVLKPISTREPHTREQQLSQDLEPENEGKWTCGNCGATRIDDEETCRLCGDMVWVRHQLEEPEKEVE